MVKIKKLRESILKTSYKAGACHIGSALSCAEIVIAIDNIKKENDYFMFSKASGISAYYCLLAEKGIIQEKDLVGYLKSYPLSSKEVPGIIHSVGSIGHGLNVSAGIAYADRENKVYCLISDGELNEGSTWEALMFIGHHKLTNLVIVIDNNALQACGFAKDILNLEPLENKLSCFKFKVMKIDGHDQERLEVALTKKSNKPIIIIADTLKGKGIDFLENKVESHYLNLTDQLLQRALKQV